LKNLPEVCFSLVEKLDDFLSLLLALGRAALE
jgi:hypothetical protein